MNGDGVYLEARVLKKLVDRIAQKPFAVVSHLANLQHDSKAVVLTLHRHRKVVQCTSILAV